MQTQLDDDEVVVCVSHGGIMGMTMREILGVPTTSPQQIGMSDIPNTGVCSIALPKGAPANATLEIFGSTDHVGPSRIIEFLAYRSGTSLPPGAEPSEWLRDRDDRYYAGGKQQLGGGNARARL